MNKAATISTLSSMLNCSCPNMDTSLQECAFYFKIQPRAHDRNKTTLCAKCRPFSLNMAADSASSQRVQDLSKV